MRGRYLLVILGAILVVGRLETAAATDTDNKTGEFIATKEWQVIQEGKELAIALQSFDDVYYELTFRRSGHPQRSACANQHADWPQRGKAPGRG